MKLTSQLKGESGQSLVLVALSMAVLLGFVALATDVGTLFHAKRNMQIAADSAAIAGAAALNYGNMTPAAIAAAAQNGVTRGVNGGAVTVSDGPQTGAYAHLDGYVEAVVSQNQPTLFTRIFHITSQAISARAVATNGVGTGCLDALGTTGPDISVTTSGAAPTLKAPQCGIISNSSLQVTSSGAPHPIVASSIGVVKGYSQTGGTVSPTPVKGIAPISDPLAYLPTPPGGSGACLPNPNIVSSGRTVNIPAGNYCGGISVTASSSTINFATGTSIGGGGLNITGSSDTVNFAPGLYSISGGWSMTGSSMTIDGSGVTFSMASGAVNITGSGTKYDLTAPTDGTYSGILFEQNPSDGSQANITESGTNSVFEGVLYFPDAPLTFTASGSSADIYLAFVVKSLSLTTSSTTINDYATLPGTSSPIKAAILVE